MLEVETEISEDEAEGKVDDNDPWEDDRKHFIKGDGSKDDSEDTANEDVNQDEVPKNQEDTVEVDKDETDKGDMMKQDKALLNRENVPEVRMESQRKPNSQHSKNLRLKELMLILMLLLLQVDVVMARDNLGQGQVEQCLKSL